MSEDQAVLDFERIGVWVTAVVTVVVEREKKWFCTCDTPSWIPPEITVRLGRGWKSYVMQVGTKKKKK